MEKETRERLIHIKKEVLENEKRRME
jgi:hypothetical protein